MPTCSCPHCGRTGIPFQLKDASTVFECARCGGKFTPLGGAVEDPAQEEESPETEPVYEESPPGPAVKPAVVLIGLVTFCAISMSIVALIAVAQSDSPPPPKQAAPQTVQRPWRQPDSAPARQEPFTPGEAAAGAAGAVVATTILGISITIFLLIVAFFIALTVLHILAMAWVAKDCRARGVDGGAMWVFIVLSSGIVGLAVYMASRPIGILVPCDRCGNRRLEAALSCPHCGQKARRKRAD